MKSDAATYFALAFGIFVIYYLAKSMFNAGGIVQSAVNVGQ